MSINKNRTHTDPVKASFERMMELLAQRRDPKEVTHSQNSKEPDESPCEADQCCLVTSPRGESTFILCQPCNPRLTCPRCHGTGRLIERNPESQLEQVAEKPCPCALKETKVKHLNAAKIPQRYLEASFSVPDALNSQPEIRKRYVNTLKEISGFSKDAELAIEHVSEPGDRFFLLLHGPVGCGKTYLACAFLKMLIMRTGATGRFIEFQQLLFELRNCYSEGRSEEDVLSPLRLADILIIDELGKARTESEWQMERLDDLINSRYNAGKLTILTTNFAPVGEIPYNALASGLRNPPASEGFWTQSLADRVGLRIYDRIMEVATCINFHGLPSLRSLNTLRLRGLQMNHRTSQDSDTTVKR